MIERALFVALSAALLVPFAGGTAQASCTDDLLATNFQEGYTESPKSEYWSPDGSHDHIEHSGTANVTVHGDALIADNVSWYTVDWPNFVTAYAENGAGAATEFVDCVAG